MNTPWALVLPEARDLGGDGFAEVLVGHGGRLIASAVMDLADEADVGLTLLGLLADYLRARSLQTGVEICLAEEMAALFGGPR